MLGGLFLSSWLWRQSLQTYKSCLYLFNDCPSVSPYFVSFLCHSLRRRIRSVCPVLLPDNKVMEVECLLPTNMPEFSRQQPGQWRQLVVCLTLTWGVTLPCEQQVELRVVTRRADMVSVGQSRWWYILWAPVSPLNPSLLPISVPKRILTSLFPWILLNLLTQNQMPSAPTSTFARRRLRLLQEADCVHYQASLAMRLCHAGSTVFILFLFPECSNTFKSTTF